MTQYDLLSGLAAKAEGMERAETYRAVPLNMARAIAREIAKHRGQVHADAVARVMQGAGLEELGPAAGSLFKGKEWEWTGEWHVSARVANHGRLQRVWRLKS